jgi:hypothetical protein
MSTHAGVASLRPKRRLVINLVRRRVQALREPTHRDLKRGECHE